MLRFNKIKYLKVTSNGTSGVQMQIQIIEYFPKYLVFAVEKGGKGEGKRGGRERGEGRREGRESNLNRIIT